MNLPFSNHATEAEWLSARGEGIGASEAAIVLGLGMDTTPHELWEQKVGIRPRPEIGNLLRVRYGKAFENHIADAYCKLTGRKVIDHGRYAIWRSPTHPFLSCTLDREIVEPRGCLEMKSTTFNREEVPAHQLIQVQLQTYVCGFDYGEVATFVYEDAWKSAPELFAALWNVAHGKPDPGEVEAAIAKASAGRIYITEVDRDDDFLEAALPVLARFWKHVEERKPLPEGWPNE